MHFKNEHTVNFFKWLSLAMILLLMALTFSYNKYEFDILFRSFCPQGWWGRNSFYDYCSYPPMAIARYVFIYISYSMLSLLIVKIIDPKPKLIAANVLNAIHTLAPFCWLLFSWFYKNKISWVALFCLAAMLLISTMYYLFQKSKIHAVKIA